MFAIVLMYVILGMFIPAFPLVLLTIPIIYPLALEMQFNPIWFGIVIVRVLEMGSISPPVGTNVFLLSGISGIPLGTIYRGVIPFLMADIAHVALLVAFPAISLFLPDMMR
jgi:TRAP-type C4-dicarboxylate transport system permease large subunit